MGHYDSCRDETWAVKDTPCVRKLTKEELKAQVGIPEEDLVKEIKYKEHDWHEQGYGIQSCRNCHKVIYYT